MNTPETQAQTPRTTALANRLSQSAEQSVRSYPEAWEELSTELETELSAATAENARLRELLKETLPVLGASQSQAISQAMSSESKTLRDAWLDLARSLDTQQKIIIEALNPAHEG